MEKHIYFNSRDTLFRIEMSRIAYFKADRNYTILFLTDGKELMFTFNLTTMKDYLEKSLGADSRIFARIGRGLIINLSYVFQINALKQYLELYVGKTDTYFKLEVSKEVLKELKSLYAKNEK